ncbi:unnamed protein product [Prorocentrum cordatum]|uniref:Peptidylprolyl isomerase n=1 Tax=Prorocentrum cordatum TaxID=2364126 RepID=A0ABN9QIJ0_9DINO|nr:unnamed protein product [Polarella glacialis]
MAVGEAKTMKFGTDAPFFGAYKDELLTEHPLDRVPFDVKVGRMLMIQGGLPPVSVKHIGENIAKLDANHPFAGKATALVLTVTGCEKCAGISTLLSARA